MAAEKFMKITVVAQSKDHPNGVKAIRVLERGNNQATDVKAGQTVEVEQGEGEYLIALGRAVKAGEKEKSKEK